MQEMRELTSVQISRGASEDERNAYFKAYISKIYIMTYNITISSICYMVTIYIMGFAYYDDYYTEQQVGTVTGSIIVYF